MEGKFYEELNIGDKFLTPGRTITSADILLFAMLAGHFEELFVNMDYVEKHSIFKKKVAQSVLTLMISMGEVLQSGVFTNTGMAHLGLDKMVVPNPVFEGDTIYTTIEIVNKKETSKPDRGVITSKHTVTKPDGTVVLSYEFTRFIRRVPQA